MPIGVETQLGQSPVEHIEVVSTIVYIIKMKLAMLSFTYEMISRFMLQYMQENLIQKNLEEFLEMSSNYSMKKMVTSQLLICGPLCTSKQWITWEVNGPNVN